MDPADGGMRSWGSGAMSCVARGGQRGEETRQVRLEQWLLSFWTGKGRAEEDGRALWLLCRRQCSPRRSCVLPSRRAWQETWGIVLTWERCLPRNSCSVMKCQVRFMIPVLSQQPDALSVGVDSPQTEATSAEHPQQAVQDRSSTCAFGCRSCPFVRSLSSEDSWRKGRK